MSRPLRWFAPVVIAVLLSSCGGSNGHSSGVVSGGSPPTAPAGPDAGTQPVQSSNPCDGLVPSPPGRPVTVKSSLALSAGALGALGDGEGNVLTGSESKFASVGYRIYSSDGRPLADQGFPPEGGGLTIPLASGFAGIARLTFADNFTLLRVLPDGGVTVLPNSGVAVADPRGGLVLFGDGVLTAYDDALNPRWAASVPLPSQQQVFGMAVDVTGNVLLLLGMNAHVFDLGGFWVDAAGNPGMAFLVAPGVVIDEDSFSLAPDVRGGLFLWHRACRGTAPCTSEWQGRYPALATTLEAAPGWLSSRPLVALRPLEGKTAYALTGIPVPECAFEVVTADGVSCGFADFSAALATSALMPANLLANAGAGFPCRAALNIGRDGTVLSLRSRDTGLPCTSDSQCPVLYDWFPGYFR